MLGRPNTPAGCGQCGANLVASRIPSQRAVEENRKRLSVVEAHPPLETNSLVASPIAMGIQVDVQNLIVKTIEEIIDQRGDKARFGPEVPMNEARNHARVLGHLLEFDTPPRAERDLLGDFHQPPARGPSLVRGRKADG